MRSRSLPAVILFLTFCVPLASTAGGHKPVRVLDITYIHPQNLDDLWRDADLVIRARVLETSVKSRPPAPGIKTPMVYTEATIHVVERYRATRADAKNASSMVVEQRAGRLEMPDEIIEVAEAEPISAGGEYILFLQWNEWIDSYEVTAGPEAIFELRDGRLRPFGRSAVARDRAGRRTDDFVGDLRLRAKLEHH